MRRVDAAFFDALATVLGVDAADYLARVRRTRLVGALLLGGAAACGVLAWRSAVRVPSIVTYGLLLIGALSALGGVVSCARRTGSLWLVLDRHVSRSSGGAPSFSIAEWTFLDGLAERTGADTLGRFVAPSLGPGVAEHSTSDGLACIEILLERLERSEANPVLKENLRAFRARVAEAEAAGARFCLHPLEAWSGQIESNLGLHLG